MTSTVQTVQQIAVDSIHPHPANPRHELGKLEEMTRSVRAVGILEPVVLAPAATGTGYTLIFGHRRVEAARAAKLATVPALVRDDVTDPAQQLEMMLVENLRRVDLSPVEEAEGYQQLLAFPDYTVQRITKSVGTTAGTVKARLKLTQLPDGTKLKVHTGQISLVDAGKLVEFADDPAAVEDLAGSLGSHNFSYALTSAKRRAKEMVEAKAAGATVLVDRDQVERYYPNYVSRGYSTSIKPGPGVVMVFPVGSGYGLTFTHADPDPDEAGFDATDQARRDRNQAAVDDLPRRSVPNPNAGGSMVDKGKAKEQREAHLAALQEQVAANERKAVAAATRLEFLREQLTGKRLRSGALQAGLRDAVWDLLYEYSDTALRLLDLEPEQAMNPDELELLGRPVTDTLDTEHLVLLAVATVLTDVGRASFQWPDPAGAGLATLGCTVRYFDFLISLGYELSDVDTEQLAGIEAAIAKLQGDEAAEAGS